MRHITRQCSSNVLVQIKLGRVWGCYGERCRCAITTFLPPIWSEIDAVVAKNPNPIYTVLNKKKNCQ